MNPGHCLVMLVSHTATAREMFSNMPTKVPANSDKGTIVGCLFAIPEPFPTKDLKRLGTLPLIQTHHALVPLKRSTPIHRMVSTMRQYKPNNILAGDQRYFVLHNVKDLQIAFFKLTNKNCCSGLQCDKALSICHGQSCGCTFLRNDLFTWVGEFGLSFPNPFSADVDQSSDINVADFRSLRTSSMFFKDFRLFCRDYNSAQLTSVRKQVSALVSLVNDNGGWTIVGWFRKGETVDTVVATNDTQREESTTVNVHISFMLPTNETLLKSPQFKERQIVPENN